MASEKYITIMEMLFTGGPWPSERKLMEECLFTFPTRLKDLTNEDAKYVIEYAKSVLDKRPSGKCVDLWEDDKPKAYDVAEVAPTYPEEMLISNDDTVGVEPAYSFEYDYSTVEFKTQGHKSFGEELLVDLDFNEISDDPVDPSEIEAPSEEPKSLKDYSKKELVVAAYGANSVFDAAELEAKFSTMAARDFYIKWRKDR